MLIFVCGGVQTRTCICVSAEEDLGSPEAGFMGAAVSYLRWILGTELGLSTTTIKCS